MIRRVLIPLDGSHFAEHAIPYAISIARRAGATVELVSVSPPPFTSTHVRGVRILEDADLRAGAEAHQRYLADVAWRIRERYGMPCSELVLVGTVFERLSAHVAQSSPDLVVMTTHGGGSPSQSWLGSVSDRMVREATVPLVLVRPSAATDVIGSEPALRRLLVPSDGTPVAEGVLAAAVQLAELFDGEVVLLGVVRTPSSLPHSLLLPLLPDVESRVEGAENELRTHLTECAGRLRTPTVSVSVVVVRHHHPATAITEAAAHEHADLIAMSTHGRSGVRRFLLGSVTDKVLRSGTLPMLVSGPRTD